MRWCKTIKRSLEKSSTVIWLVNLNHILWGVFFLIEETPIPSNFGATIAFTNPEYQSLFGLMFILVALCSVISDFFDGIRGTILLIPQQLVVTYGCTVLMYAISNGAVFGSEFILSACVILPLTAMHTVAVITRYTREHHAKIIIKLDEMTERI